MNHTIIWATFVCLFVCLFVPILLPGPWADLHQTWKEGGGRPRILAWGVHFLKDQGHRGQRSNLFFFLFVPLLLPGPWADLHQTWWAGWGRPRILARGVHLLKVKVIEVKGQISVSPRSLGWISQNLEGWWRGAPDIGLRGSFFERSRSSRSKVKFMFLSVCSSTSQVLGPIFTKHGGKVEGGPGY